MTMILDAIACVIEEYMRRDMEITITWGDQYKAKGRIRFISDRYVELRNATSELTHDTAIVCIESITSITVDDN